MADQSDSQTPMLSILKLKLIYSPNLQETEGFWRALFGGHLRYCIDCYESHENN